MFIGQSIACINTTPTNTGTIVYTPWFPRQGDGVTSLVEVIALGTNATVDIGIQTKNSEETDDELTPAGSFTTISSAGTSSKRVTSLLELVRYKLTVKSSSGVSFAHLRMLNPSWEASGAQGV